MDASSTTCISACMGVTEGAWLSRVMFEAMFEGVIGRGHSSTPLSPSLVGLTFVVTSVGGVVSISITMILDVRKSEPIVDIIGLDTSKGRYGSAIGQKEITWVSTESRGIKDSRLSLLGLQDHLSYLMSRSLTDLLRDSGLCWKLRGFDKNSLHCMLAILLR
ncbi:hypothetical protein Tco_0072293 [Tanacetum coccineum]